MTEYLIGVAAAALVNYATLSRRAGEDDILTRLRRAAYLGGATVCVTLVSSFAAYFLYYGGLSPLGLQSSGAILFLLSATLCAAGAGFLFRFANGAFAAFVETDWPLLAMNGVIFGVGVHAAGVGYGFTWTVLTALGASAMFAASLLALTAIDARLDPDAMPKAVRGWPALFLSAALIAMALTAFAGF